MERKVALITGGGTGIGRSCSLMLAKRNYAVAVNYSNSQADAYKTVSDAQVHGVEAMTVRADVSDDRSVRQMIETVVNRFGRVDALVNCAGVTDYVPVANLEDLKDEHWQRVMDVNVKGIFQTSRAAAPHLKKCQGVIINVLSIAAYTGVGSSLAYAASKGAALSLTKGLASVLAPDVRVNGVAPGIVQTRWVSGHQTHVTELVESVPLGRVASPDDISEVVCMLCEAKYMTGEIVKVDGGKLA